MAPSQTKIMLSGVDCADYIQQRVGFWSDVYGSSFPPLLARFRRLALPSMMKLTVILLFVGHRFRHASHG